MEWETTPSELEAMILESRAIRKEKPRHNVQIKLHASDEKLSSLDGDLIFVVCDGDPAEVSVFFLRDGEAWARARLARDPDKIDCTALRGAIDGWIEGRVTPAAGLRTIEATEGPLVLRYLRLFGDSVDRIRMGDFPRPEAIVDVLVDLATRERPLGDPWFLRSPAAGSS